jgi:hypothetical protein
MIPGHLCALDPHQIRALTPRSSPHLSLGVAPRRHLDPDGLHRGRVARMMSLGEGRPHGGDGHAGRQTRVWLHSLWVLGGCLSRSFADPAILRQTRKSPDRLFPVGALSQCMSGGVLLSHTVTSAVPSALKGLASGFGMEPGVSPSL